MCSCPRSSCCAAEEVIMSSLLLFVVVRLAPVARATFWSSERHGRQAPATFHLSRAVTQEKIGFSHSFSSARPILHLSGSPSHHTFARLLQLSPTFCAKDTPCEPHGANNSMNFSVYARARPFVVPIRCNVGVAGENEALFFHRCSYYTFTRDMLLSCPS